MSDLNNQQEEPMQGETIDVVLPSGRTIEYLAPPGLDFDQLNAHVNSLDWDAAERDLDIEDTTKVTNRVQDSVSRGIKLNNPGNIRRSKEKWEGLSLEQKDGEFFSFESPEAGLRAMAKILQTYKNKHKIDTVDGVVSRWAPPNENDTVSYADFVAARMGINPSDPINLESPEDLVPLMKAMTFMEVGENYEEDTIREGVRRAGIKLVEGEQ